MELKRPLGKRLLLKNFLECSWILTQNVLVGIIVINVFNFSILSQCSKQNVVGKKKDYVIYYCNISNAGGS